MQLQEPEFEYPELTKLYVVVCACYESPVRWTEETETPGKLTGQPACLYSSRQETLSPPPSPQKGSK